MTDVNELLKPRYKVIADYPSSNFLVDEILIADESDKFMQYEDWGKWELVPKDYPAIFKQLAWYEERDASEMPEYVKFVEDFMNHQKGEVYKFENWNEQFEQGNIPFRGRNNLVAVPPRGQIEPATLEEYQTFHQKQ